MDIKRIMIVDDALFVRHALKSMLEGNGFEVVGEADNGINALVKFKELRPDVVTMDITMPEMDGIEALRRLKEIDPNCKVIMISALGQENKVKESIIEGAKGFIVKPFKEEKVVKVLADV